MTARAPVKLAVAALVFLFACAGCVSQQRNKPATIPAVVGLAPPIAVPAVDALCRPPIGWIEQAPRHSSRHDHFIWLSPSGKTAYGIIRFSLPFPVGEDLALWGFMTAMKNSEGDSKLISQQPDPRTGGIDFVAEGGPYLICAMIVTEGFHGWAVYAGAHRNQPLEQNEMQLALRARTHTVLGLGDHHPGK